jgi:hypothetical protein
VIFVYCLAGAQVQWLGDTVYNMSGQLWSNMRNLVPAQGPKEGRASEGKEESQLQEQSGNGAVLATMDQSDRSTLLRHLSRQY